MEMLLCGIGCIVGYKVLQHHRAVNATKEQERNTALENTLEALQERKALQERYNADLYQLAVKSVSKNLK